jgi:hypothetical protein
MARKDNDEGAVAVAEAPQNAKDTQATVPADGTATPATEVQATEVTPEATDTKATEATAEKPAGPSAEEVEKAVVAFLDKAKAVAETRDKATGEITDEQKSVVKTAYGELPTTPARTKARNGLDEAMKSALSEHLDAALARAYMILGQTVKAPSGRSETVAKAPVDPTEAFIGRMAAMTLAPNLVEVPEGVAEDWVAKVQQKAKSLASEVKAYRAYLADHSTWTAQPEDKRGDEPAAPEVSEIVLNAHRFARGRAQGTRKAKSEGGATSTRASTYSGPRRSVKTHISNAFADKAPGTFLKIAEIANTPSDEYGDDRPSSGAVSAALFPSSGKSPDIDGVEPAEVGGVKGARKVA